MPEPKKLTLNLPFSVPQTKKKNFHLNLNVYRNAHFLTLSKAKVTFEKTIADAVKRLPLMDHIILIEYVQYPPTKRLSDNANICSIVDKFFSDAIVNAGIISDDNYTILKKVSYEFGSTDPVNPRVEARITFIPKDESEDMRIIFTQPEIELAVKQYAVNQMGVKEGMDISIEMKSTRGEDGITAEVNILPLELVAAKAVETVVAVPATAKAPEPKEETPVVEQEKPAEPDVPAQPVEAAPVEAVEETAPVSKSLFGGVTRPVND